MAKKEKKKYTSIGGQALMEGIMMRGPHKTVMCVRRADGSLQLEDVKQSKTTVWNKIPIIRGVVAFVQSMTMGTRTLMRSADIAIEDEMAAEGAKVPDYTEAAPEADGESATAPETAAEAVAEGEAPAEAVVCESANNDENAEASNGNDVPSKENAESVVEAAKNAPQPAPEKPAEKPAKLTRKEKKQAKLDAKLAAVREKEAAKEAARKAKADAKEAAIRAKEDVKIEKVAARNPKKAEKLRKQADKRAEKRAAKRSGAESDNGFLLFCSTLLGFGLAILLFIFLPTWLVDGMINWLFPQILPEDTVQRIVENSTVWRPIFEGIVKLAIFIVYFALCSMMKEIKRLFQYHGAEHKTIFCYEAGEELTVENVRKYKRFHPRCGTSFLILMMLVGIAAGVAAKAVLPPEIADSRLWYPLIKLALIPLIMGVGYELLKFAGKHDNIITRIISAPGIWMQRITTKEPTDDQIECAIAALKPVIPENGEDMA